MSEEPHTPEQPEMPDTTEETSELSDEQLEALIKAAQSEMEEGEDEEGAAPEAEEVEPAKPVTKETVAPAEPETEPEVEAATPETPEEVDVEALQKRLRDSQEFIQKQATEIGQYREYLRQQMVDEEQAIDELYTDNPKEAVERQMAMQDAYHQDMQYAMAEQALFNKSAVLQFVPDFEDKIDDIAEVLKEDKIDDTVINQFRSTPYLDQPALLVHIARRADTLKENRALKARVEELEKMVQSESDKRADVISKIEKAASRRPTVRASAGKAEKAPATVDLDDVHDLSDEQLDAILNEISG